MAVPGRTLQQALQAEPTLHALLAGHQRAQRLFEELQPELPPSLRTQLRPGPIDGTVWTLFVASSAAGAKLRQLLPRLLTRAQAAPWSVNGPEARITEVKIKVQPKRPLGPAA